MIIDFIKNLLHTNPRPAEDDPIDAEYEPARDELTLASLSEEELRQMDSDDRVTVLEQAQLDPYDDIYLAC